jgi:Xaa-Pro aminopeptidase
VDVRGYALYDARDPRPPALRSLDTCVDVLRERGLTGRVGFELSHRVQGVDRMVGEPGVVTYDVFRTLADVVDVQDATSLLATVRMLKTSQEIERIRLANDLAADALEHVRAAIQPGMRLSEVGALYEGFVHANGIGYRGQVAMARGFVLALSGRLIRQFTPTLDGVVAEGEPTLLEIWVCADGYWSDLGKSLCPGRLTPEYDRLLDVVLALYDEGVERLRDGVPLAEVDRLLRRRIAASGYPPQRPYPMIHGVGARAHEPPWAHEAGGGEIREGMVLAIEPGIFFEGGGGVRLEDNYLITANGPEKLCRVPDDFRRAAAPAGP